MALGDLMATTRLSHSSSLSSSSSSAVVVSNHNHLEHDVELHLNRLQRDLSETTASTSGGGGGAAVTEITSALAAVTVAGPSTTTSSMVYLPQTIVFCELRHEGFEDSVPTGPAESGLVSKWRPRDRMKTGMVALVLCLNISVDPPDVIKISPCARMECWIDPFSLPANKAVDAIGAALNAQYERWQPKARYKPLFDPTTEEIKKTCLSCRKYAKTERVLFHYNGHGVPKPTASGEIWLFNKSYTQYIPLPVTELDSWLKSPSIYVFDCSAAGHVVNSYIELIDASASSGTTKDCILLAACEAHETLPQSAEFPADIFTSCLTTPIQMALRWSWISYGVMRF